MGAEPGAGVSAVVVNYNARDHLLACVRSLRAEGIADVVVADNASADGSVEALAAADPACRMLGTGGNLGYGRAANRGAAATSGDHLLVMNSDAVLAPGALDAMGSALERDERVAIVGPRIERPDGTLYPSARTFPSLVDAMGHAFLGLVAPRNRFTRRYRMLDWDHARFSTVDWVSGSCFLTRRSTWNELGGFDESYFMYAEDVDLCWRARRAGWEVAYEPAAVVVHAQGVSADRHPYRMIVEHHRALLRFATRSTTGARRLLLPVVAAGLAVRTVLAWAHRALSPVRARAEVSAVNHSGTSVAGKGAS
jgi:N-acetylglucosaminyl-diphospho-decaprenol L-rhamnosyltransferase